MTENIAFYIGIYLFVVSLWAIWLTLRDKRAARLYGFHLQSFLSSVKTFRALWRGTSLETKVSD